MVRFPNIQEVAVAVLGEGFHDSEVWQDVEFALRGVLPRGIRIVYDQGCIFNGYDRTTFCVLWTVPFWYNK